MNHLNSIRNINAGRKAAESLLGDTANRRKENGNDAYSIVYVGINPTWYHVVFTATGEVLGIEATPAAAQILADRLNSTGV